MLPSISASSLVCLSVPTCGGQGREIHLLALPNEGRLDFPGDRTTPSSHKVGSVALWKQRTPAAYPWVPKVSVGYSTGHGLWPSPRFRCLVQPKQKQRIPRLSYGSQSLSTMYTMWLFCFDVHALYSSRLLWNLCFMLWMFCRYEEEFVQWAILYLAKHIGIRGGIFLK